MTVPQIELSDKTKIPQIGFGTWLIKNEKECKEAVKTAIEVAIDILILLRSIRTSSLWPSFS